VTAIVKVDMMQVDLTSVLLGILSIAALAALALTCLADRAIKLGLQVQGDAGGPRAAPPITVLKPVKGVDEGLAQNFASLLGQEYPRWEVLVGAASGSDPALAVVRQVAANFPHVSLRIVVCPDDGGLNPKVSILRALSEQARYDHVLISDSNVRVTPGYLAATAAELGDARVGLVTNPIAGRGEESVGAIFEGVHLTTYVARALAFARVYLGHACVVGKSMLFRLSDWRRLGGWVSVRDVLAEDYAIGHAFEQAGFRVAVCPRVIFNYNHQWPISRFINRHLRWGQMRRRVSLPAYLLEPLLNPLALLVLLAAAALVTGREVRLLGSLALLGTALRLWADRALLTVMRGNPPPLSTVLLGLPKDLLMLGVWATAGFRRTIDWRGNKFRIEAGTRLVARPTSSCAETVMVLPPR
jgi:ceramide glucosyltransferase